MESTTLIESVCRCVLHLSELIHVRAVNKHSPPIACCLSHLMTHMHGLRSSVENGCHTQFATDKHPIFHSPVCFCLSLSFGMMHCNLLGGDEWEGAA